MSIFVRDFIKIRSTGPIISGEVMRGMVGTFRGRTVADLRGICHEFSLFVFRYLGFSMNLEEVADAWKDVEERIRYDRVESTRRTDEERTLTGTFGYVELVSLQSGVLARMERRDKVQRQHVNEAFWKIECPFKQEGWCD